MAEKILTRAEIPEKYKWNLTHIYPSDEAWQKDYDAVCAEIPAFAAYDGKVAEDPRAAIRAYFTLLEKFMPIYEYAFLRKETDNADPVAQGLKDKASRMYVQGMTVASFLQPELLAMDESVLKDMISDPEMKDYDTFLRNLLRQKAHTLSKDQEKLVAMTGEVMGSPDNIFTALTTADMKLPPVTMPDGTESELTEGNYSIFIHSSDRDVRRQAFHNLMTTYGSFGNTIAGTYGANVKKDQFMANAYNFPSAVEASLYNNEIPLAVYDNLVSVIHEYIPVLQDYLRLRKSLLNLDELHLYDLYCPMVAGYEMDLPYDKAACPAWLEPPVRSMLSRLSGGN